LTAGCFNGCFSGAGSIGGGHDFSCLSGTGNFTAFIYLEDDIRVRWPELVAWAADTIALEPYNLTRGFIRTEVPGAMHRSKHFKQPLPLLTFLTTGSASSRIVQLHEQIPVCRGRWRP
jgi:hypothetical protein